MFARTIAGLLLCCVATSTWAAPFAAVTIEDESIFTPEDLLPLYQLKLGTPLNEALQRSLTTAITGHYQREGYLAPAPRIARVIDAAGIVVLEIQEPHVARVQVSGREYIEDERFWLLVQQLKQTKPLSRGLFEEWLSEVNKLGLAVQGNLIQATADSNLYLASVRVTEKRWHGLLHLDNRAPEQLGRELLQASFGYRAADERVGYFRLDAATAEDPDRLFYLGLSGTHRLLQRGDTVRWKYSASDSTLPIRSIDRDVEYDRARAELEYKAPLTRRARHRSDLIIGARAYHLDQHLDDGRQLRRDRIRAAHLGYSLAAARGKQHLHRLELSLEKSLATDLWQSSGVSVSDEDFLVAALDYHYRYAFASHWQTRLNLQLQYSDDHLPSSERFSIGGGRLGGALDPATLSGDKGLGLRWHTERKFQSAMLETPVRGFVYYDHGYVWSNDPTRPADDAGSLGIGVKLAWRGLSIALEAAHPVVKPESPSLLEEDSRLFFSLSQQF